MKALKSSFIRFSAGTDEDEEGRFARIGASESELESERMTFRRISTFPAKRMITADWFVFTYRVD